MRSSFSSMSKVSVRIVTADERGMIHLLCPFCGDYSIKPLQRFPIHQPVSMLCSCGKMHECLIETRKIIRKKTALNGFYVKHDSASDFEGMKVMDLSLQGCCLLATDKHTLHVDDSINVAFNLDNFKNTEIKKHATVRWIMGNKIGCRLAKDPYDPDLGRYVEGLRMPI